MESFKNRTIPYLLERRAREEPQESALQLSGLSITGRELNERTNRVAHALLAEGVRPGERVALMSATRPDFVFSWLALAKIGAVAVPVNTGLKGGQLANVLTHSQPHLLIAQASFLEDVKPVVGKVPSLREVLLLDSLPGEPSWAGHPVRSLESVLSSCSDDPGILIDPRSPAALLYTGGTTGPSKGVVCSHSQYYWWARLLGRSLALGPEDIWYIPLPLFHINAQATLLAAVAAGACCLFSPKFSAAHFWTEAKRGKATIASLLGTMAHILYHKRPPESTDGEHVLKSIFCPGVAAGLQEEFAARFRVRLVNAYGMTELNCVTSTTAESPHGSMGKPLPEFEVRLADVHDQEVGAGETGEILVRPRLPFSIMSGYYRMPEQTLESLRNLWFHTGDRARMDDRGNLYFVDRLKDCIRRRGENISSFEIEEILNTHPDVLESAAFPVASELGEEDVMVSVVPKEGHRLDPAGLLKWCESNLATFAVPRYLDIVRELPKTEVGRIQKFKLREKGVGESTWDREK